MSKLEIPIIHDEYAKSCIIDYVIGLLSHYLDLPDPDDELRDIAPGLYVTGRNYKDTTVWSVTIASCDEHEKHTPISCKQYLQILEACLYLEQGLPDGMAFFEIYYATDDAIELRYVIDRNEPLREWFNKNFK